MVLCTASSTKSHYPRIGRMVSELYSLYYISSYYIWVRFIYFWPCQCITLLCLIRISNSQVVSIFQSVTFITNPILRYLVVIIMFYELTQTQNDPNTILFWLGDIRLGKEKRHTKKKSLLKIGISYFSDLRQSGMTWSNLTWLL